MRVLAIDTALAACSAAVLDTAMRICGFGAARELADAPRACRSADAAHRRVMDQAAQAFADLDRVVVTTGPGSFTGLAGRHRRRARYCAGDQQAGRRPIDALRLCGALSWPPTKQVPVVVAIDARHEPRLSSGFRSRRPHCHGAAARPLSEAVRAASARRRASSGRRPKPSPPPCRWAMPHPRPSTRAPRPISPGSRG
jgi:tRNA threonylcarbamoyladenosine biosynthesis protein TsaB